MKRNWNWAVWTGASLVFLGVTSYPLFFVRFPPLRDFPWANLPMIALGLVLLALGLVRAFRHSDLFRGKIFGSVLAVLALAFSGLFLYAIFIGARHVLPASHGAPQVGQTAPDFTLPDSQNHPVSLTGALNSPFTPESTTRDERGQGSRRDFDFLPWILVTVLQLRVTEFRAGAAGIRCKENSSDGHQCGFSRGFRKPASVAGLHVSDSFGCTGGRDSQVGSCAPSRPARRCRHLATGGIPYRRVGEGALGESYGKFRGPRPARRGARSI
jgi:hypothetical protein